ALFSHFALLSLIFAAWNVEASMAIGLSVPSVSAFIIFQSCLVFGGVGLALADLFYPKLRMSRTLLECGWVGVLSMFHMGSALGSLLGEPEADCHSTSDRNICVSASLLVPVTWLNAVIFLTYFLALFVSTMVHKSIYPNIWKRSIYSIQWYEQVPELPTKEKVVQDFCGGKAFDDEAIYAAFYHDDVEASVNRAKYSPRPSVDKLASWVDPSPVRRGIDPPFASQPASRRTSPTNSTAATLALPSFPHRSADPLTPSSGSRYVEKFRESSVLARAEGPAQYARHYHSKSNSSGLLPALALDFDQPIPLTRMSKWVKADEVHKHRSQGSGLLFAP
ncbi:hypothetical protein BDN70DRAFT_799003, partial [Pholiota conissans]